MKISATISQLKSSHRRKSILTNEWVLVSPHRLNRPWQGQSEETQKIHYLSMMISAIFVQLILEQMEK